MNAAALIFGVLTILLAGPVPVVLARAQWTSRVPSAALVLWQAIALGAVLSAFAVGITLSRELVATDVAGRTGFGAAVNSLGPLGWTARALIVALTMVIGARLVFSLGRVVVRTRRGRASHRDLIDLLGHTDEVVAAQDHPALDHVDPRTLRVLNRPEPLAYCVPGRRGRLVVSEGAIQKLDRREVAAIIEHERSHLRSRHDLVIGAFTALTEAFPRFLRGAAPLRSVELLIEMIADDAALSIASPRSLARALVTCAGATAPAGAMAVGGPGTVARIRRLTTLHTPSMGLKVLVYTLAAAILAGPLLGFVVPWIAEVSRFTHAIG